jgi:hypothetical protein
MTLAFLCAIFAWAIKQGIVPTNPLMESVGRQLRRASNTSASAS